ncbi:synaptojanin-1 isoform X2 [Copidosoma floridanum]|uniref:synaptojanin-1 isoform X2 n=1 Tax=Copidosoma floridanum TaxID=29053 RepID=UPI000C6FA264|nr:synaptojanin-1 isoform X2 [Copidosoma floridanum]
MAMGKSFRIYEKSKSSCPYSIILEHRNYQQTLLFESEAVAELTASETESLKPEYQKLLDSYGCLGVLPFHHEDNNFLYLIVVTGCHSIGKIYDSEIFRITQVNVIPLSFTEFNCEDRISEVRKVLNSGTFYFSWSSSPNYSLDVTLSVQTRFNSNATDNRYFWNRMLHLHLLRFGIDTNQWLIKMMCGSIEIRTVYVGHRQARAVIISRLSCERAGTRFNVRGTNDDGHVANFVESEQIIYLDNEISSFIQNRGSVPLFWEQPGIQVGSHKIKISRGFEVSALAFSRHLSLLKNYYGKQVIVNLLGSNLIGSKEGEAMLCHFFQSHHCNSQHQDIPHILFDYHQECKNGNLKNLLKLKNQVSKYIDDFSYFHAIGEKIVKSQTGTIRTNCLDCLDRTNCVQTYFALEILKKQLISLRLSEKPQITSRFEEVFRQMWVNNGNEISKIYAGTGAIQGNSKIIDGARSAARTIQNNLLDSSKQEAIDILLFGSALNSEISDLSRLLLYPNIFHAPCNILHEMCKRYKEYVNTKKIKVAVATYNVNGGKHFRSVVYKEETLSDWLLDVAKKSDASSHIQIDNDPVDIFAIGFEEIVDLNASNIVAASTENTKAWADELQKVISRDCEYVLVTYQQLVGVCLYIYIRSIHANFLRDVAVDCVKTGLGGATGNKGATAIRFVLYSTSFCFVCAHFAAGQSQVNERNADFAEITKKIIFPMGRTLNDHDYVFWCGDFNYRVDMNRDEMKELLKEDRLEEILKYDQLKIQHQQGNVFEGYLEGPITFPPTYKYDLFSNDYDTSEKCRQPAWTDRILWKRRKMMYDTDSDIEWTSGNLVYYLRGELKQSDHRPVIAVIDVNIYCIDEKKREIAYKNVVQDLGPSDGTVIISDNENSSRAENIFDENFMNALVQNLSKIGKVILIRFVEGDIWVTFKDGQEALAAVKIGAIRILDYNLKIRLKTQDWVSFIEKEIGIFKSNESAKRTKVVTRDIVPELSEISSTFNQSFKGKVSNDSSPLRPSPPSRPPPPVKMKSKISLMQETSTVNCNIDTINSTNYVSNVPLKCLRQTQSSKSSKSNPPPLPSRHLSSALPEISTLKLTVTVPPPIPSRTCDGPPIPRRNDNLD